MSSQDASSKGKKRKRMGTDSTALNKSTTTTTTNTAPPRLSAVAARKLALQQQREQEQTQEEEQNVTDGSELLEYTEASAGIGKSADLAKLTEQSDEDDQEISRVLRSEDDDIESETSQTGGRASTSNSRPLSPTNSNVLRASTKAQRYFSSAAAWAGTSDPESGNRPSSRSEKDTPLAFGASPGNPGALRRNRSKKRRRGEDAKNLYIDPDCVSSWRPDSGSNYLPYTDASDAPSTSTKASSSGFAIGMHASESLISKGVFQLRVLKGQISISNALVSASTGPLDVFAPANHPLPVVRAVPSVSAEESAQPPSRDAEQHLKELENFPVIILLLDKASGIEGLEHVARVAGMPIPYHGMWVSGSSETDTVGEPGLAGETFRIVTEPERDLSALLVPENWRSALASVIPPPPTGTDGEEGNLVIESEFDERKVYLVQGAKGVGKSTFSKLLVNTLFARFGRVAYLDCDLGQAELTPPGLVSLHVLTQPLIGPAFTQVHRQPKRAHYIGSTTPKNHPSLYLSAILDLLGTYTTLCEDSDASLPLVINTQGWVKGLGADLLGEITRTAAPSTIFDFASPFETPAFSGASRMAPAGLDGEPARFVQLQPFSIPEYGPSPARLTPTDLRTLSLIAYFHLATRTNLPPSAVSSLATGPTWDFSRSLVHKDPYSVSWGVFKDIQLLGNEQVAYEHVLHALDVSVVALIELDEPDAFDSAEEASSAQLPIAYRPERGVFNSPGNCVGLGILRSIDSSRAHFHILTHLASDTLSRVNALQKGDIELPTVLMVDYIDAPDDTEGVCGKAWKEVPYLESREEQQVGLGTARRRVRRNVMRKSQFR